MSAALPELLGLTVSESIAFAVGIAMGPALHPIVQELTNESWALAPFKPVDIGDAASIVAENVAEYQWGENEAGNTGYDPDRFRKVLGAALNAPGLPELLRLWRRGEITEGDFVHGLRKARFETRWDTPVESLKDERLDPSVIATAIQRGIMDDPGFLPVEPPSGTGNVPRFPVSVLDALNEAKASGINRERLFVETAIVGLPASPEQAASAYFRGIGTLSDYERAISEGNVRNEWRHLILEQARQIVTAHDGVEGRLRGWLTDAQMYAQTARHGMSQADTDLLFKITGRPISFHQVFIGERRGGSFDGPTAAIDDAFLKSLKESNIRPEWYNLAWAQRHSLPSAFVLRALLTGGVITAAQGETLFLHMGWPPDLAKQVADHYGKTTTAVADPHVTKAQNQLWTRLHASYLAGETETAQATATLTGIGVSADAIPAILGIWNAERGLIRKQLTPAQVKKAYAEAVINPVTGVAWTHDDAIGELVQRGYSLSDATTFLEL